MMRECDGGRGRRYERVSDCDMREGNDDDDDDDDDNDM